MLTCTCTRVCGCEMVPKLTRFKRRVEAPETPVRLRSGPLLSVYRFDSCHRHQAAVAQWKEHLPTKQGAGVQIPLAVQRTGTVNSPKRSVAQTVRAHR